MNEVRPRIGDREGARAVEIDNGEVGVARQEVHHFVPGGNHLVAVGNDIDETLSVRIEGDHTARRRSRARFGGTGIAAAAAAATTTDGNGRSRCVERGTDARHVDERQHIGGRCGAEVDDPEVQVVGCGGVTDLCYQYVHPVVARHIDDELSGCVGIHDGKVVAHGQHVHDAVAGGHYLSTVGEAVEVGVAVALQVLVRIGGARAARCGDAGIAATAAAAAAAIVVVEDDHDAVDGNVEAAVAQHTESAHARCGEYVAGVVETPHDEGGRAAVSVGGKVQGGAGGNDLQNGVAGVRNQVAIVGSGGNRTGNKLNGVQQVLVVVGDGDDLAVSLRGGDRRDYALRGQKLSYPQGEQEQK